MDSLYNIKMLLQTWIEDESIDDDFVRFINWAIEEAEDTVDWDVMYGQRTVTVEAGGILTEPAESRKIIGIYTAAETDGRPDHEFYPRDREPSQDSGGLVQYTANPYEAVTTPLGSVSATITQGSATITSSAAFDTSWEGERLIIGTSKDLYEIDSVLDTSTIVLRASVPLDSGTYTVQVRPIGTRQYLLLNNGEAPFTGNVVVKYQKKHPELVEDADRLLIPCTQTVSLIALQNALMTNKYDVDAERLSSALILAKNREIDSHLFRHTRQSREDRLFSVRTNRTRR